MRAKALTAAVVAAVMTVGLWSAPVHAAGEGVPGGFASWDELFATQLKMIQAADVITAAAAGSEGLAGISAKPERREVWVYWKGAPPAAVMNAVAKARTIAPVQVKPARFSRAELQAAAAEVARLDGVTVVGPLGDGSGLRVSTVDTRALAAVQGLAAVTAAAIPLTAKPSRPALAGRQNSTAPHYGGAAFTKPAPSGGFSFCTTGFAIYHPRAGKRMLTAGHCGANGETVYNGTTASVMGTVSGDNNAKDTMLINTTESGRIYADGFNSNTSKPVLAAFGSYEDTLVCTSGAMTGEHCKIRITNTGLTIDVGYDIGPVVEAVHDDELPAAGEGDSGGPVVAQDSNGLFGQGDFVNVYAQGTITAIDLVDEVPCVGMYDTTCAYTMYYVDIMDSLAYYNSTIATG